MLRAALLVSVVLAVLAPSAAASTRVGWATEPTGFPPPFFGYWNSYIVVQGDDGANHQITIQPSGGEQLGGYPTRVDIYDYGDTFVQEPITGVPNQCEVWGPHWAVCRTSGPPQIPGNKYSYYSFDSISVSTGDGNDSITLSDRLNPIIASFGTGAGDDNLNVGYMWQLLYKGGWDSLGPGDDHAQLGPAALWQPPYAGAGLPGNVNGREIYGGSGNDTIESLNGAIDSVHCDDGTDTWIADPFDNTAASYPGGNTDDCESRTPPGAPGP